MSGTERLTDPTLDAARRGSREARETLVRALQNIWYRFCLSLLRDPTRAADATQETALRFLRDLPGFDGRSSIKTWSLGIAMNVVRETRRMRIAGGAEADQPDRHDPADSPLESALSAEQQQVVRDVLADLPDRQREAIVLRFFEDLSIDETARAMNAAPGTVKATIHQALRAMRKIMQKDES